jgi:hypothetical protein
VSPFGPVPPGSIRARPKEEGKTRKEEGKEEEEKEKEEALLQLEVKQSGFIIIGVFRANKPRKI